MAWWDDKAVENEDAAPLDEETAKSFSDGNYKAVTLTEDVELYRVYGYKSREATEAAQSENPPDNIYMTTEEPTNTMYSRTSSALKPEWGNRATHYEKIQVPAGTTVYVGQAEEQTISEHDHALVGGADQVVISQNDFEPEMVTEKDIKLGYSSGYGTWEKSIKKENGQMPTPWEQLKQFRQDNGEPITTSPAAHEHEKYSENENQSPTHVRDQLKEQETDPENENE